MTAPDRDPLAAVLVDLDDALSLATRLKTESVYIGWMTAEDARALRAALAPRPPETADAGALDAAWAQLVEAFLTSEDGDGVGTWPERLIDKYRPLIEAALRSAESPTPEPGEAGS